MFRKDIINPVIEKLRTSYESLSPSERIIFEQQQASLFFDLLDNEDLGCLKQGLLLLLNPKLIAAQLSRGSDSLADDFKKLGNASDLGELNTRFLNILYLPFGLNPLGAQYRHYHKARDTARKASNNHCNSDNIALFTGTQHLPFVNGFSIHAYTFARYLAINKGLVDPATLELIIQFFYFNYIQNQFHSFAEIDAAFIRASEDAQYQELNLLSGLKTATAATSLTTTTVSTEQASLPLTAKSMSNNLPTDSIEPIDVLLKTKPSATLAILPQPKMLVPTRHIEQDIHELQAIKNKICGKLQAEMTHFLKRKKIHFDALNENDKLRYKIVSDLHEKVLSITKNIGKSITQKPTSNWKQAYKNELSIEIKDRLLNNHLDKYNSLEKIGISLLNLVSFVFSPIKFIATGSWFYSTKGKSKEAVEEAQSLVDKIEISP